MPNIPDPRTNSLARAEWMNPLNATGSDIPKAGAREPDWREQVQGLVQQFTTSQHPLVRALATEASRQIGGTKNDDEFRAFEFTPLAAPFQVQEGWRRASAHDPVQKALGSVEAATGLLPAVPGEKALAKGMERVAMTGAERAAERGAQSLARQAARDTQGTARMMTELPHHEQLKAHIDTVAKDWKTRPMTHVVQSVDHLPPELAAKVKAEGGQTAKGFVGPDGKSIYLLADNIKSKEEATSALFHEGLGHMGLNAKYGEKLDSAMSRIAQSNRAVAEEAGRYLQENPQAYAGDPNRPLRAVEEVLAQRSERGLLDAKLRHQITSVVKEFGRKLGMKLSMSDQELAAILRSAQNKIVGQRSAIGATGANRYMYVGERGMESLRARDPATLSPAARKALEDWDRASTLREQGLDEHAIRNETGVSVSPHDQKTRLEISDKEARFSRPFEEWQEGGASKASDEINHPLLHEIYPEAVGDLHVSRRTYPNDPNKVTQGWWDENARLIGLTPYSKDPLNIVLHEVQHAIQTHEGFARGSNPSEAIQMMTEKQLKSAAQRMLPAAKQAADAFPDRLARFEEAVKVPGLDDYVAARVAHLKATAEKDDFAILMAQDQERQRAAMFGKELYRIASGDKSAFDLLANDINGIAKLAFEKGYEPNTAMMRAQYQLRQKAKQAQFAVDMLQSDKPADIKLILGSDEKEPYEAYKRVAGEIEARDTQGRQNLTDRQRRLIPPGFSKGYDPADVIVPGRP